MLGQDLTLYSTQAGVIKPRQPFKYADVEESRESNMINVGDTIDHDDPFALGRFTSAQKDIYNQVLAELRSGRKRTHWMWYIFPQLDGLGTSATTKRYAIKCREEARRYLKHPVLGSRLRECAAAVLAVEGRSVAEIFGYPDDQKLQSSMTLFASIADPGSVFAHVLDKYFHGEQDVRTLHFLENLKERIGAREEVDGEHK
jgi:uncharacterized protein (DUF1810 family)